MHVRQQIRDAAVTLLRADSPTKWNYVFNTRLIPDRDIKSYLVVYIDSEDIEDITIHGNLLERGMILSVVAHVRIPKDFEKLENDLDDIAIDIENRITQTAIDAELTGEVKSLTLSSTASDIVTDDNDRTYAEIALTWLVRVMTQGDPETLS